MDDEVLESCAAGYKFPGIQCFWRRGAAKVRYFVESKHTDRIVAPIKPSKKLLKRPDRPPNSGQP